MINNTIQKIHLPYHVETKCALKINGIRHYKHTETTFWATVCKTVRPVLSDHSVLSVKCGQTVGRIKMKLGMQVGLSPGLIVLDGDPAPPPQKGQSPLIFGPCLLCPNSCIDKDATWYGSRPRPRLHCARWGPSSPPPKRGHSPPIFGPCFLWPNGLMDQDAT